jgi:hypothetical protein
MVKLRRKINLDSDVLEKLRDEVEQIIKPWYNAEERPPWTDVEVAVICLIMKRNTPTLLANIEQWWMSNFRFVRASAAAQIQLPFHMDWNDALYLTPLTTVRGDISDRPFHQVRDVPSVRQFLHKILHSPRECASAKHQDLISTLPYELRIAILEMVLTFPEHEVHMHGGIDLYVKRGPPLIRLHPRMDEGANPQSYTFSVPNLLAVFAVSTQFEREAWPIFYAKNVFAFTRVDILKHFLVNTHPERRNHIRHLVVQYEPDARSRKVASSCFRLMQNMQGLRKLGIKLFENNLHYYFDSRGIKQRIRVQNNPLKLAGIPTLAKLRLEEVEILGDCPTYRAHLAQMVKPKEETVPQKPSRKRKAVKAHMDAETKTKALKTGIKPTTAASVFGSI